MTNLLDKMGLGPKRETTDLGDGSVRVSVTPPARMQLPTQSLILTGDQYARYVAWRGGHGLIQDLLPELARDEREVLMTGIGAADFARLFPPEEDE